MYAQKTVISMRVIQNNNCCNVDLFFTYICFFAILSLKKIVILNLKSCYSIVTSFSWKKLILQYLNQ